MAENVPTIASTNFFSLAATFGVKEAELTPYQDFAPRFDADGNYLCSQEYNGGNRYRNVADFCGGATPDIVAQLATILTTFGDVENSKLITQVEIGFEAGVGAEVTINGHDHTANTHVDATLRTADVSGVIPALSGVGVPGLITVTGTVSPSAATVNFEMEHVDKPGADGTHFEGQNMRCHVTLSVDYAGQPSGVTDGNWLNIILVKSNPNDDTPTATLTAEQWIDVA